MKITSTINWFLRKFGVKIVHVEQRVERYSNVFDLDSLHPEDITIESRRLLNLLNYTKRNRSSYNGAVYESGYHTLVIDGREVKGQRDPLQRLAEVPFNFNGTTVLDIGSNQGGMLFALADKIKFGVGIDFDYKMVNVANRIALSQRLPNIRFYVFDLEQEDLGVMRNFMPSSRVDIVFLLAVCMWITTWREVIDLTCSISDALLFESNGSSLQQDEQAAYLRKKYREVVTIQENSTDDPTAPRKLFLCRAPTRE